MGHKKLFLQSVVLLVATINFAAHGAKEEPAWLRKKRERERAAQPTPTAQPGSPEFKEFFRLVTPLALDILTTKPNIKYSVGARIKEIKFAEKLSEGIFFSPNKFSFLTSIPGDSKFKNTFIINTNANNVAIQGEWENPGDGPTIKMTLNDIPLDENLYKTTSNDNKVLLDTDALIKDLQAKVSEILMPFITKEKIESTIKENVPGGHIFASTVRQYLFEPTQAEKKADEEWEKKRQEMNAEIEAKFPAQKKKEEPKKSGLEE